MFVHQWQQIIPSPNSAGHSFAAHQELRPPSTVGLFLEDPGALSKVIEAHELLKVGPPPFIRNCIPPWQSFVK